MRMRRRITVADRRGVRGALRRIAVVSSKGTSFFNDALGTTVVSKSGKTYSAATLSAFGEDLNHHSPTPTSRSNSFFTGKPHVAGLGHAFLMRNYRAGLAKWQTADPLGYPDGWNQLAYCGNGVTSAVDLWGCVSQSHIVTDTSWGGWGPYVSEDGIKASFCIYAYGTCNHDYDNLDITACGVALSVGCTDLLYNYKSKDGKIGSINFDYAIVGISKPLVTIGFAGMKTAYADITVDLSLDFTYYVKVVTNGKEEYKPFHVIIASTQYVFHLKDSVSKPFRSVKE